jgi:hypothetical protein
VALQEMYALPFWMVMRKLLLKRPRGSIDSDFLMQGATERGAASIRSVCHRDIVFGQDAP